MSPSARILVVDDDPDVVDFLVESLQEHGYQAEGETSPRVAVARFARGERFDLVVSDLEMPEMRGLELMAALHAHQPDQLIVLITAFGSVELAVRALREGAADFVTKPFPIEVLIRTVERVIRERSMRREIVRLRELVGDAVETGLVARSESMAQVLDRARRAARFDSTVLITGESGVGKGAVARFIHEHSARSGGPFVQVNAAALPEALVESELFGVRRGAFTDAREDRAGIFRQADGGTLFLDEVAELPIAVQPKLLLALETRRVRPVGGTTEQPVDLRLVTATNSELSQAVDEGRFRPDLYYRLNIIPLHIPPLRERSADIEPLVTRFVQAACERMGRPLLGVCAPAMRWFHRQAWPGNVRELANVVERAVALADHDTIVLEDLESPTSAPPGQSQVLSALLLDGHSLQDLERQYLRVAMRLTDGNKAEAARMLGIDRRTLYRKLDAEPEE